jgi:hypothetical protein
MNNKFYCLECLRIILVAQLYELNWYVRGARWPRGQCARRAIAEVKQLSKRSRAFPSFAVRVKPLVSAAFAFVSTNLH